MAANNEPGIEGEEQSADGKATSQQRRIFGTKRLATPPPAPADARPEIEQRLANLVDSVKDLQSQITNAKAEPPPELEPKPRRLKRFQRMGTEETTADPDSENAPENEALGKEVTLNKNIAWPRLARADASPPYPHGRAPSGRKQPLTIYVLAQIAGLALLLLGYWFGQGSAGDEEPRSSQPEDTSASKASSIDPLVSVGVSDRALDAANQGLQAEKNGNLDTARQTWQSAVAGQVRLPGAAYRLAMLDIQRGDYSDADIHLSASLAAGEMMASCYLINARFAGRKSNYVEAARQIEHAVHVEPFNARYLFYLGEAQRRAGRYQKAIDAVTQALVRPASPTDTELFTFKLRLARVMAGHDHALEKELADNLAKKPVRGDWLMLAAADDLNRAAFPAAAGHLQDAAHTLTPDVFNLLARDFAFQGYAAQPEVAALLKVPPPPSVPFDPSAWPTEEGDPAVWTPYSPAL